MKRGNKEQIKCIFASQCINQQCNPNWIYSIYLCFPRPIASPNFIFIFFSSNEEKKKKNKNHNGKEIFAFVQITINSIEATTTTTIATTTKKGNIFTSRKKTSKYRSSLKWTLLTFSCRQRWRRWCWYNTHPPLKIYLLRNVYTHKT